MIQPTGEIIVGILGQWASGKSTAAKTLVRYLGGEDEVVFISDRELLARQAVNHILELDPSKVKRTIEADGNQRLEGECATVYLRPGEDLETVDLNMLQFDLRDEARENGVPEWHHWFNRARVEMGYRVCELAASGKPIVIEAGFGSNREASSEKPLSHTISDLFMRLAEAGLEPKQVKWMIVEASYERRSARNKKREDTVPSAEFDRYAFDGGDLDPDYQHRLEEQGTFITRVPNDHDDLERFRAEIIAAFEAMYRDILAVKTI